MAIQAGFGIDAPVVGTREGAGAAGDRPSLDKKTQLPSGGYWNVAVYPEVGEAVLVWISPRRDDGEVTEKPLLSEEERLARNHERATRRANVESMRYIVANRLRYMWVLTFAAGLHDAGGRAECMRRVADFAERLRARYGALPYWYSPELHPGGHGWHVNFFVGRRLKHPEVAELWGHGVVWVKDWTKDSRVATLQLTFVDALRLGAQYGCKYASKDWSSQVLQGGAHRYEVAQGFKPRVVVFVAPEVRLGMAMARSVFGCRRASAVWSSSSMAKWDGPPVRVMSWRLPVGGMSASGT